MDSGVQPATETKQPTSEAKAWPKVAIIVLNWNGWRDTIECLESLQRLTYLNYQIIVVDNGSTDDSVEKIKAWARGEISVESKFFEYDPSTKPVQWIEYDRATAEAGGVSEEEDKLKLLPSNRRMMLALAGENLGFSGGYNVGLQYALTKKNIVYILVVNNDVIVSPDSLTRLVKLLESDRTGGMAGGKVFYYHDPRRIWFGGGRISWLRGRGIYLRRDEYEVKDTGSELPRRVSFLTGAFWLIKATALTRVGLLPTVYFMGGEESEYSYRMTRAGFTLWYDPNCVVWHKVGRSHDLRFSEKIAGDRLDKKSKSFAYISPKHVYNWYRYLLLFQRRNLPLPMYIVWYALFRVYAWVAMHYSIPSVRHREKFVLKKALIKAIHDHKSYTYINIHHLAEFEKEYTQHSDMHSL
jgi:GT2 family glycosyltransferase